MKQSLVDFRNMKGLSQREMASEIGITLSHYSKIELGLRNPSYTILEKFKSTFDNVSVDEIFFKD